MSLRRTLDLLAAKLDEARSVPLSASCMVNRAELRSLVERARAESPAEIDEAALVLSRREELLDGARREARDLVEAARHQAGELVSAHAVVSGAQVRADQILDAARTEAARLLRDADDYCDRRLGGLEDELWATLGQVRRGRHRLQERSGLDPSPGATAAAAQSRGPAPDEEPRRRSGQTPDAAGVGPEDSTDHVHPPSQRRVLDLTGLERTAAPAAPDA